MQLLQNKDLLRPQNDIGFIDIPSNWWISNNSYYPLFEEKELKVIQFPAAENKAEEKLERFKPLNDWDIKYGDHRVKEAYKDMSYYIELKKKLLKNSIYAAIVLGGTIVYYFSKIIARF